MEFKQAGRGESPYGSNLSLLVLQEPLETLLLRAHQRSRAALVRCALIPYGRFNPLLRQLRRAFERDWSSKTQ
jgi:hypothetical protein